MIDTAKEREWAVALGTHAAPDDGPDEVLVGVVLKNTWEIRNAGQALRARYLAALDALDAQAAEIERLREVIDAIEILNETSADENGHRWENSDLIGQEIRSIRAALAEREP